MAKKTAMPGAFDRIITNARLDPALDSGELLSPSNAGWEEASEADDDLPANVASLINDLMGDPGEDEDDARASGNAPLPEDHYANLAEYVGEDKLGEISRDLLAAIQVDYESMSTWLQVAGRALKEVGLDRQIDSRSDPFPGASGVIHPALGKAAVDFRARVLPEMCPPNGPVRIKQVGAYNKLKERKSYAVREHMNYQLTVQVPEYRDTTSSMMFMLPIIGSWFRKPYWDVAKGRPSLMSIAPGDLIVNMGSQDLDNAELVTHAFNIPVRRFEELQRLGVYLNEPIEPSEESEEDDLGANALRDAIKKIVSGSGGYSTITSEINGFVRVYECYCMLDLDSYSPAALVDSDDDDQYGEDDDSGAEDDDSAERTEGTQPYIVSIDCQSGKILAIRRNWSEDDARRQKIMPIFHYKFVAWHGFFGLGLFHLMGGIQHTLTGGTRALLDTAQIQNAGGGVRLKGARISGSDKTFSPLEFVEMEADFQSEPDVSKLFALFPRTPPSPVLFQLLQYLAGEAQSFAGIALQQIADMGGNTPATTMLALIEQGSKAYATIHADLHFTQGRELQEIARLNGLYLDDAETIRIHGGELVVSKKDYDAAIDIIPVSDPNIFSDAQRAMQAQAVLQLAQQHPGKVNVDEAIKDYLFAFRVPSPERYMVSNAKARALDPVSEFQAIIDGKPTDAFQGQDHAAHVAYLLSVSQDPQYQPIMQVIGPQLQALTARHLGLQAMVEALAFYEQQRGMAMQQGMVLPPPDPNQIAQIQAQAAQSQSQQRQQIAAQQAQQQGGGEQMAAQAMMLEAQASMEDVKRKASDDVAKAEQAARKAQLDLEELQAKHQRELLALQQKSQAEAAKISADLSYKTDEADKQRRFEAEQAAMDREVDLTKAAMSANKSASVKGPIGSEADGSPTDGIMARTIAWLRGTVSR